MDMDDSEKIRVISIAFIPMAAKWTSHISPVADLLPVDALSLSFI